MYTSIRSEMGGDLVGLHVLQPLPHQRPHLFGWIWFRVDSAVFRVCLILFRVDLILFQRFGAPRPPQEPQPWNHSSTLERPPSTLELISSILEQLWSGNEPGLTRGLGYLLLLLYDSQA